MEMPGKNTAIRIAGYQYKKRYAILIAGVRKITNGTAAKMQMVIIEYPISLA